MTKSNTTLPNKAILTFKLVLHPLNTHIDKMTVDEMSLDEMSISPHPNMLKSPNNLFFICSTFFTVKF